MQSVLGDLEWKIIQIKENSAFCGVTLIIQSLKNILWIVSGNMDAIMNAKETMIW